MDQTAVDRRQLKHELQQGLQRHEFVLHYQLQMELATGRFTGVEALVRWNHPQRGLVMPDEFIPAAEANGLIRPLGAWILNEACRQARLWHERGWHLSMAVILSPVQLRDETLAAGIDGALKGTGLDPTLLELEIPEGTLMENIGQAGGGVLLPALTAGGVRLAIHGFGTGYSSLAYLKHLPVHTIKIDRSFIRDLGRRPHDEALVQAIVTLGKTLGKRMVGEGVENPGQLAILRRLGCDVGQGFHIARPVQAEQLDDLLAADGCRSGDEASARKPIRRAPNGAAVPSRAPQSASVSLRILCTVPAALRIALKARKIVSSDQLLAAAGVFEQRVALAALAQLDLAQLTDVVCRADLARIPGIGRVFTGMLVDLGIGIATLALLEKVALREQLFQHNRANRIARRSPSPDEVADWIDRAANLPVLVTHALA